MQTFSEENYLKAIWKLAGPEGDPVSTNAIAGAVQTKAASVTDMLKKLSEKKLIDYVPYKGVSLTKSGFRSATEVVRKHRLWEVFLVDKLGFGWDEVHEIAEQLEHIRSEALTEKLDRFLGFPKADPHGDPIPDKSGKMPEEPGFALALAGLNKTVIVTGVADHSSAFLRFLDASNIRLGNPVTVSAITDYDQSMTIRLKGKRSLHISRDVAQHILVRFSTKKSGK
jgi:DtxR family Mn-dependent transcriptional regulator